MPGSPGPVGDLAWGGLEAMLEAVKLPSVPPLPSDWPFVPEPRGEAIRDGSTGALPGLGEGWRRFGRLDFEGLSPDSEPLGGRFGRGGLRRAGELILRPYRRGGFVRHFNGHRYGSPERFARELQVHEALWQAGFPTTEPLGYAWRPAPGWGVEGVFLSRFAPGLPWPRDWSRSGEVLAALLPAIRALCAWGLWAPDLNATNVHLPDAGGMLLLDWDRAAWTAPEGLGERYRRRLLRSLEKLGAPAELLASLQNAAW